MISIALPVMKIREKVAVKMRYKIIDALGRLKTVDRPREIMQYYVDIGLAMEELPDYGGWRSCYKGWRGGGGKILVEPHEWDNEKMMEAYSPLILVYRQTGKRAFMR